MITKQLGVLGGYGDGSSVGNAGIWGFYWSSTWNDANNAYRMGFNSSNVYPQVADNKDNGFAVRCVKNWEKKRLKSGKVEGVKKLKS